MIPTLRECYALLQTHRVPEHIIQHSRQVHRLALSLSRELILQGERLNQRPWKPLPFSMILPRWKDCRRRESFQAGLACSGIWISRVAEIVRQHVVLDGNPSPSDHRSDGGALRRQARSHTSVVSLAERFQDLKRDTEKPCQLAWLDALEKNSLAWRGRFLPNFPSGPNRLFSLRPLLPGGRGDVAGAF